MSNKSENIDCTSSEIRQKAQNVYDTLLPEKSKDYAQWQYIPYYQRYDYIDAIPYWPHVQYRPHYWNFQPPLQYDYYNPCSTVQLSCYNIAFYRCCYDCCNELHCYLNCPVLPCEISTTIPEIITPILPIPEGSGDGPGSGDLPEASGSGDGPESSGNIPIVTTTISTVKPSVGSERRRRWSNLIKDDTDYDGDFSFDL